jgi:hypothetical protein
MGTQPWEPTEAELVAVIADYCKSAGPHDPEQSYGCPEGGCADCRIAFADELRRVGPMIAARALREAAEDLRGAWLGPLRAEGNMDALIAMEDASGWLTMRAAEMDPPEGEPK